MSFAAKVAVVTGGTSGIGRATALLLARQGADLVLVGRDEKALGEVVGEAVALGVRAASVQCDVTSADAPERIVSTAVNAYGGLDILVNAAGVIATGTV